MSAPGTANGDVPCPQCGMRQSKVIDVRGTIGDGSVRRRRQCVCTHRYTTKEILQGEWDELQSRLYLLESLFARLKALGVEIKAA